MHCGLRAGQLCAPLSPLPGNLPRLSLYRNLREQSKLYGKEHQGGLIQQSHLMEVWECWQVSGMGRSLCRSSVLQEGQTQCEAPWAKGGDTCFSGGLSA